MTTSEVNSEPVLNSIELITELFQNSNQKREHLNFKNLSNPKSTESHEIR